MEKNVHGFKVRCEIVGDDASGYKLQIVTSHRQTDPAETTWPVPDERTYETWDEAQRRGKYIVLGIDSVDPSGKPKFTVA